MTLLCACAGKVIFCWDVVRFWHFVIPFYADHEKFMHGRQTKTDASDSSRESKALRIPFPCGLPCVA